MNAYDLKYVYFTDPYSVCFYIPDLMKTAGNTRYKCVPEVFAISHLTLWQHYMITTKIQVDLQNLISLVHIRGRIIKTLVKLQCSAPIVSRVTT